MGPLVSAPLSELYGRLIVYHVCNVLFVIFSIACALSTSMDMLIVFRFFAGAVGVTPVTIGGGTIADIMRPEARGGAMVSLETAQSSCLCIDLHGSRRSGLWVHY